MAGQLCDCGVQRSQFVFDDGPDQVIIDLEVSVHEDVVHPDNFSPWYIRPLVAGFLREPACGLTDDLEMSHDPYLDEFVVVKGCPAAVGVALDSLDSFENVLNAVRI